MTERKTHNIGALHGMRAAQALSLLIGLVLALGASACSKGKETIISDNLDFDGTCVNCHAGLEAKQVHGTYKLRCVDCHGGDDQVEIPAGAFEDEDIYADPDLIALAHVKPKPGLARFFYGNGMDDDGDGIVDEGPEFEDDGLGGQVLTDFGEIAEPGLQGEGVGQFVDSEFNRDLNYTRWLNPGDLRVATVGCGSSNAANNGDAAGGCHQSVVDTNRRSVMVNQSAVINGAYYGNESWRESFQQGRDLLEDSPEPRRGGFGYALDYDGIDGCILSGDSLADPTGRAQPRFDSTCLEALAETNDPNAVAGAPGNIASNVGLADMPAFEATQGTLVRAEGAEADLTIPHIGGKDTRFPEWGGKPLEHPEGPMPAMQAPLNEELIPGSGIPDPVDTILRGFRAYFPLNYPGSVINQDFTFGQGIRPNVDIIKTNNPFGRGHSAGCTACHMKYNFTGARDPQKVARIENGETVFDDVSDPTTKHREFDPDDQDIQQIGGERRLVGMAVTTAQREFSNVADQDQQKHYSKNHTLTAAIDTDTCGMCHAFVTRINFAYTGTSEEEQRDDLARLAPIEFSNGVGDNVRILDSFVREENGELIEPEGLDIIQLAVERDKLLAEQGIVAGVGGCAPETFTEDCNNNGRLDEEVVLTAIDVNGKVVGETTISEDLNGNNILDLIDRTPRFRSFDGRQARYVYGGATGATRLMDIHYEVGMHCIDCHQLQDNHGDGHLYGTNHEVIEIECDDCHGSAFEEATLTTSGSNGGNRMDRAFDHNGRPFFERKDGKVIQHSRVTPGLSWEVPQLPDTTNPQNAEGFNARTEIAHSSFHLPLTATDEAGYTIGSEFAGEPGKSELVTAKLECYTCHTSWMINCLGCHENTNLGDLVRKSLQPDGTIIDVPGENEVWLNNSLQSGATNFQLLSFMRGPFILGSSAEADGQRLAPFRSSMIVHPSINDAQGTLVDSITFTTFQEIDANSGRANVATSGSAMNQTMPHTVRPEEVKSCEQCHSLVDNEGRVRNDHIMGETMGLGANRYGYLGDWVMMAGGAGIEFFEFKQENQFPGSVGSSRYPGITLNAADRVDANVEPIFDGSGGIGAAFTGTDITLIRNFNKTPAAPGLTQAPTFRDLVVSTHTDGATGVLLVSDVSGRGHPSAARPSVGNDAKVSIITLPAVANALAHIAPDISDPYVYIANGGAGLTTVKLNDAPNAGAPAGEIISTVAIPAGGNATEIVLAGDVAYVGTDAGTIEVFNLDNPEAPVHTVSFSVDPTVTVNGLEVGAFMLFVGTTNGLGVVNIINPLAPALADGADQAIVLPDLNINELSLASGHAYLAVGTDGVLDVDITTAANPVVLQNLVEVFAPPAEVIDAKDVVVNILPGQQWVFAADVTGDLVGFKLDTTQAIRERCAPSPQANGCGLDMDFRDPAVTGRDPAFDPNTGAFFAADPSGEPFFRQASGIVSSGGRMARPGYWEKINSQTGRRMRDSFMPGSGTLSLPVMQRMYGVQLCEDPASDDINGNGLGQLGIANASFLGGGACEVIGLEAGDAIGALSRENGEICRPNFSFNAVTGSCQLDVPKAESPTASEMVTR